MTYEEGKCLTMATRSHLILWYQSVVILRKAELCLFHGGLFISEEQKLLHWCTYFGHSSKSYTTEKTNAKYVYVGLTIGSENRFTLWQTQPLSTPQVNVSILFKLILSRGHKGLKLYPECIGLHRRAGFSSGSSQCGSWRIRRAEHVLQILNLKTSYCISQVEGHERAATLHQSD